MKNQHKWLLMKAAIITLFISLIALAEIDVYAVSIIATVFICVMILSARRMRKAHVKDERIKKIGAYSGAYSWMITLIAVSMIFWIDHLGLYVLSVKQAVLIIGAIMLATQIGFQWIFMKRGDI
jgi:hypothetical protein